jgi:CubicO group peptidase (beta-lactamase class C family)
MALLSQPDHVQRFFKCGFPRLSDYKCFNYDTISASNPKELSISPFLNTYEIPRRFMTRMMLMRTTAFIVIKDNQTIYEQYWLNFDSSSVMNSFSVSKSIVALLLGIAIKEGKVESINQRVSDFLPQFKNENDSVLRIIDLLTMSSGLNWNEDFTNPFSDIVVAYYGSDIDSLIKKIKVVEEPGKKWKYLCGNTIILSLLLEKATGVPIYQYAQEKLWIPLGAEKDAYWSKDDSWGITKAFCCFYATPRDFAKLGILVLNKGMYNGQQIVPKEYIETITKPSTWLQYNRKPVDFYGQHIWFAKHNNEMIPYFSGMFGQYVFIFPKENAIVVRFGEMLNELTIMPLPPDVPLYLKVADKVLKHYDAELKKRNM